MNNDIVVTKKESRKTGARIMLFAFTWLAVMVASVIIFRVFDIKPWIEALTYLFNVVPAFVISAFLSALKFDRSIYHWMLRQQQKHENYTKRRRDTKIKMDHEIVGSGVVKVTAGEKPMTLILEFDVNFDYRQIPEIKVAGYRVGVKKLADRLVELTLKGANSRQPKMAVDVGEVKYEIDNPFRINPQEVAWQCEGHQPERKIVLFHNGDTTLSPRHPYLFELHIDGRYQAKLAGHYDPERKELVIPLGKFKKKDCGGRKVVLKVEHDKTNSFVLPEPVVFS